MNGGATPPANWYPDPHAPAQLRYWDGRSWTDHTASARGAAPASVEAAARQEPADPSRVLALALLHGLVLGVVAGGASGTVAAPVIGTVVGVILGAIVAFPVSLVAATVISRSAGTPGFPRRVDVTLLVLGIATAVVAIGWISLRALVGPWPALTMLAVVVVGLLVVRPRLHRLGPALTG